MSSTQALHWIWGKRLYSGQQLFRLLELVQRDISAGKADRGATVIDER
jgi:hypothetical protein